MTKRIGTNRSDSNNGERQTLRSGCRRFGMANLRSSSRTRTEWPAAGAHRLTASIQQQSAPCTCLPHYQPCEGLPFRGARGGWRIHRRSRSCRSHQKPRLAGSKGRVRSQGSGRSPSRSPRTAAASPGTLTPAQKRKSRSPLVEDTGIQSSRLCELYALARFSIACRCFATICASPGCSIQTPTTSSFLLVPGFSSMDGSPSRICFSTSSGEILIFD